MTEKTNNNNNSVATYRVLQTKYSTGYGIFDLDEPTYINEQDITDEFEAEEGAEWIGVVHEGFFIDAETLEENGYTQEGLRRLPSDEIVQFLYDNVSKEEFMDIDRRGAGIYECEEEPDSVWDVNEDGDGIDLMMDVHFRFEVKNGDLKMTLLNYPYDDENININPITQGTTFTLIEKTL